MPNTTRGFLGRRRDAGPELPPGQHLTDGFPVLSTGPTPLSLEVLLDGVRTDDRSVMAHSYGDYTTSGVIGGGRNAMHGGSERGLWESAMKGVQDDCLGS